MWQLDLLVLYSHNLYSQPIIIIKIKNVNNSRAYWDIQSFRWISYKDSSQMYIAYCQKLECF